MGISELVMLTMMGHMVVLGTVLGMLIFPGYWSLQLGKKPSHLQHIVHGAGIQAGNMCGWSGEKYT